MPALSPRRARVVRASTNGKVDRAVIIARDNSTCYLCGKQVAKKAVQIDHVFPLAKGGSHTYENLRVACATCNGRKGDLTLDEFRSQFGTPYFPDRNAPWSP